MKGTINAWLIVFFASLLFLPAGLPGGFPGSLGDPQKEMGPIKGGNPGPVSEEQIAFMAKIQARHEREIMKIPGVIGIGIGMKDREPAFVILVDKDAPRPAIPAQIQGIPVAAKFTGKIVPHNGGAGCIPCHSNQEPLPAPGGQSISTDQSCFSCTRAFIACRNNIRGFVTNRHCNGDANGCPSNGVFNHYERSLGDNGCQVSSLIGLTNFVAPLGPDADAAFVASTSLQTSTTIKDIGVPAGTANVALADCIHKSGRTTGHTFARVTMVNASVNVGPYACGFGTVMYTGQLVYQEDPTCGVGPISNPGDSGSPVLDLNNRVVALNFAGGGTPNIGIGTPIATVLTALGITFGDCPTPCVLSAAVGGTPEESSILATFTNFRDQVLSKSTKGQEYIRLYYDNSAEATSLFMRNWRLLSQARQLITRFTPVASTMAAGRPVTLNQKDVEDVDQFLMSVAGLGVSTKLQNAIQKVRSDLRSSGVQAQFNVTVSH